MADGRHVRFTVSYPLLDSVLCMNYVVIRILSLSSGLDVSACVSTHALEFSGDKAGTRRRPPIKTIGHEEKALVDLSYHSHRRRVARFNF